MSLQLLSAPPRQGVVWVKRAFAMFFRKPVPFASLFGVFLLGALLAMALPYVGGVLLLVTLPLLTLGFMTATRSALAGGPVHPGQIFEALRAPANTPAAAQRKALLALCVLYAVATAAVLLASDAVDGGAFEQLQRLLAGEQNDASRTQIEALLADGSLFNGMLLRFGGSALLSVPFWHAPALVAWHGQGVAHALFSSTLACWRNRGAFVVYGLAWIAVVLLFGLVAGAAFSLLGTPQLISLAAVPAGLVFSTVFYVSLYFTFADSFSAAAEAVKTDPAGETT